MKDNFFGTKLNSILLLILIILVVFAIYLILQNKEVYLGILDLEEQSLNEEYLYKDGILGNKDDLVYLSFYPYTKVKGILSYRGTIKGGYFFEGNILINITDKDKNALIKSNAVATSDWMTVEPVSFEGNIDFRDLPKGPAYFEIKNDNPSGDEGFDKSIFIPIVIE